MTAASPVSVVIVGGGFSGTMMALHLAELGVRSTLIEQRAEAGRGVAYGTHDPIHLLNVPAAKMSGWQNRPDDFAEEVSANGAAPGDFVSRRRYGDYLSRQLGEAVQSGTVVRIQGKAVAARRGEGRWTVALADERRIEADRLVLATGNARPEPFPIPGLPDAMMVQDPWASETHARLVEAADSGEAVLLIGTGLTMVDMLLSLESLGHRGPVTAVSRRGLVPRAHGSSTPVPPPEPDEIPARLSDAVRWLRERGGETNWRGAVDSLRPVTQRLWARWPDIVKRRFLRHARPYWDVHRHRIAPEAASMLERRRGRGELDIVAGRVMGGQGGSVRIDRRGHGMIDLPCALVINCTGPNERLSASRNTLLQQMLADQLIAPGPLGIGIAANGEGWAGDDLVVLGPLAKGELWEITAVPDVRHQIANAAGVLGRQSR